MDGHDLSVCEANAAKKGEATKKTKGLVSTNNYLAQDNMPRETDPLLWWKEKAAWNNGILLPLTPVEKSFPLTLKILALLNKLFRLLGR